MNIQFKNGNFIHFFDNGYGELGIMIKGERGGEHGDFLMSKENARKLKDFLFCWLTIDEIKICNQGGESC